MLSTDTTRLDFALAFCHQVWVSPLMVRDHTLKNRKGYLTFSKILLALGLLIGNLGVSALVAVAVLVLGFPAQGVIVKFIFKARRSGLLVTDARVRLLQEVVQGIRLVKIYAWVCHRLRVLMPLLIISKETLYGHKIDELRRAELKKVRTAA